ncbi:MAG: hypothetical protein L0H53_16755 [Candidatus Nitrosocosmicus sp.]|nr:hypothetical protein [Candidatus Nitrosocosmicus sp.]
MNFRILQEGYWRYKIDKAKIGTLFSYLVTTLKDDNDNDIDNFIASPKGTQTFPFTKKCRTIAKRNKTILITVPTEICHLLKIDGKLSNMCHPSCSINKVRRNDYCTRRGVLRRMAYSHIKE